MTPTPEQEHRWMSYFLDECDAKERDAIAEEIRKYPEEAEAVRMLCTQVRTWAKEEVDTAPLDLSQVYANDVQHLSLFRRATRSALPWAAAALFVFALSQVSFSVSFGDNVFAWGQQPALETTDTDALIERLHALEAATTETGEFVEAIAQQTLALQDNLEETATELSIKQEMESIARYRDIERLINMSSLELADY